MSISLKEVEQKIPTKTSQLIQDSDVDASVVNNISIDGLTSTTLVGALTEILNKTSGTDTNTTQSNNECQIWMEV